jgi:hypothetical protein
MSSERTGALHLVSAYAAELGLVLAQRAVERQSSEITAIPARTNEKAFGYA